MTDQELLLRTVKEAQLVLAAYIEPGTRDPAVTFSQLLTILDRNEVIAAVDRIEGALGLRLPY